MSDQDTLAYNRANRANRAAIVAKKLAKLRIDLAMLLDGAEEEGDYKTCTAVAGATTTLGTAILQLNALGGTVPARRRKPATKST